MAFESLSPEARAALDACAYRTVILPASWSPDVTVPDLECVVHLDWGCLASISMELLAETVDEASVKGHAVLLIASDRRLRDAAKRLLMKRLRTKSRERKRRAIDLLSREWS
jgi:ABC-type transporter Mla MlaB component